MNLDTYQIKASKCLNNHSLIIAGAGSGKTTTLIQKVENLIEKNVNENEILVLSFTNETVNNFKSKCKHKINILTFHKLALNIIKNNFEIIDEFVLDEIIENYLINIPNKLKIKIYKIYCGHLKKYTIEKYSKLVNNKLIEYIKNIIKNIKTNNINDERINFKSLNKNELILLYITLKIKKEYTNYLIKNNLIDYDDMIIKATSYITNKKYISKYKYILVDEFQDISLIRLNLLKALIKQNNSYLTAVGDDWQSIYGFSGSNVKYFLNFKKEFPNCEIFYLNNTYRCPKKIINKASTFICKNKLQIKKKLTTINNKKNCIKKIYCNNYKKTFTNLISKYIYLNNINILILSRNNYDIYKYINKEIKFINSYLIYKNKEFKHIRFLTIHKAKGLEADIVIIINLKNSETGLPSKKKNYLLEKILCNNEIKYAEERRLFYVAITRCKYKLYLIIDRNNPSSFIKEI